MDLVHSTIYGLQCASEPEGMISMKDMKNLQGMSTAALMVLLLGGCETPPPQEVSSAGELSDSEKPMNLEKLTG